MGRYRCYLGWLLVGGLALAGLFGVRWLTGSREIHRELLEVNFPLAEPRPGSEDWPWWRGTHRNNFVPEGQAPLRWTPSENVVWQTRVPGRGHASPIVWDGRVYVTAADEARRSLLLMCLDRQTGESIWQTELQRGRLATLGPRASQASATPACDGERIFVASPLNDELTVSAVDLAGRMVWQRSLGTFATSRGYAAAPVLWGSLVIVSAEQSGRALDPWSGGSHLTALHRATGKVVWKIPRQAGESRGTPVVARIAGREQLILTGKPGVSAYDPANGQELWNCRWNADRAVGSVAFDEQCVYASIRNPQEQVLCIRADGKGDVTATHVVWRENRAASEGPSPLVCGDELLILSDEGTLTSLEKSTGKVRWKKRLTGTFVASPIGVGPYVYCVSESGSVFVIDRRARGEITAENPVGRGSLAAPAVSGNSLIFRSEAGLLMVQLPSTPYVDAPQPERRRF